MPIFGGPCKQLVKYDGYSLDLSGLGVSGPEPLKLDLGHLQIKRELMQVASEIAQLLDAVQYSNCVKIEQTPKDSPERIKLIYQAMESERQLVQLTLLTKLIIAQPNSEHLQKALAEWVASHATRAQELSNQVQKTSLRRGTRLPDSATINSSLERAKKAEPRLAYAIQRKASFDMEKVLNTLERRRRTR
jgi:hypothetical protein